MKNRVLLPLVSLMVGMGAQSLQAQSLSLGTVRTYFTDGIEGSKNGSLLHIHGMAYDHAHDTIWLGDTNVGDDIFEFDATQPDFSMLVPLTRLTVPVSDGSDLEGVIDGTAIEGIGYDDTDDTLWYVDRTGMVRHIDKSGVLLGSFQATGYLGLAIQGDYIWVDGQARAYQYQKDGTFTGVSIPYETGEGIGLGYDSDRDLLWVGHWFTGVFDAYSLTTGLRVFTGTVALPGEGRGHNMSYGAGKLWIGTETLDADVIYSIEVNDFVSDNEPPDCSDAAPTIATLWPPNHKFVDIAITGVTDPDGDPVTITIDSIYQDEPVHTRGSGSGRTSPDAMGVGTDTASVRAERNGNPKTPGNGRVYHIAFTADDGNGGTCSDTVTVCVPHDQSDPTCVDEGPLYDSTLIP